MFARADSEVIIDKRDNMCRVVERHKMWGVFALQ